jgi:hypothetical protein
MEGKKEGCDVIIKVSLDRVVEQRHVTHLHVNTQHLYDTPTHSLYLTWGL